MNTESQVRLCVQAPGVALEEGTGRTGYRCCCFVDHPSTPGLSPLSLGGFMPALADESGNHWPPGRGSQTEPSMANPSIMVQTLLPARTELLLIIQGMVQLCKSVGSLCPTAVFCRSRGEGCQSPSSWVQEGEPPSPGRGGINPPTLLGPQREL